MIYIIAVLFIVLIVFALRAGSANFGTTVGFEKKLYRLCRGDKAQVERLIALEQSRREGLSREKAAKDAVESFKRDNR